MKDWVQEVLARYGQDVTVETNEGSVSGRAFLQPVTERDERIPGAVTGIGWTDGRLWMYLGQTAVAAGDAVAWNGWRFRVRSSRPYYIGGTLTHWWASLEREKEAAE